MNIGVIHATLNAVDPLTTAFQNVNPDIKLVNFVNEELLAHTNRVGGIDEWGMRNFTRLFMQAAESQLDGIIIACSMFSTFADEMQCLTDKKVIAIDGPMIDEAVRTGNYIGIIATTASAGPIEEHKILEASKNAHKTIRTKVEIRTTAMAALKAGNVRDHDEILKEAAATLKAAGCDTIVLSQITMARAKPDMGELGIRVLTSPESGAIYMNNLLNSRTAV